MIYMMILKNIKKILKTVRILTLHAIKYMRKDKKKQKNERQKLRYLYRTHLLVLIYNELSRTR